MVFPDELRHRLVLAPGMNTLNCNLSLSPLPFLSLDLMRASGGRERYHKSGNEKKSKKIKEVDLNEGLGSGMI